MVSAMGLRLLAASIAWQGIVLIVMAAMILCVLIYILHRVRLQKIKHAQEAGKGSCQKISQEQQSIPCLRKSDNDEFEDELNAEYDPDSDEIVPPMSDIYDNF
jgi:hypothetical protein